MAKTLIFRRTEYVREYYEVQWIEEDYQNFLNCCSAKATEEEQDYVYQTVLKFSNNMTGSLIDSKVPIIENKYQVRIKLFNILQ